MHKKLPPPFCLDLLTKRTFQHAFLHSTANILPKMLKDSSINSVIPQVNGVVSRINDVVLRNYSVVLRIHEGARKYSSSRKKLFFRRKANIP